MENGKPRGSTRVTLPPRMNENLQQAGVYLRSLQDRFGETVWNPGKQRSQDFAKVYPVTAAFIAIFATLAFIPVASYLALLAFVLLSSTTLAVAFILAVTCFVGFWAGVFLFFALVLILGFALVATLSLLGAFLFIRLVFHLRSEDGQGVQGWVNETRGRLVSPAMQEYAQNARKSASDYYTAKQESLNLNGDTNFKSELVE